MSARITTTETAVIVTLPRAALADEPVAAALVALLRATAGNRRPRLEEEPVYKLLDGPGEPYRAPESE